jgi:hypothetical protein
MKTNEKPFFPPLKKNEDPNTTTLAGLLTTGYSNDISKNGNSESKTASREPRGL